MNVEGFDISWKGHDGFRVKTSKGVIYFDPYKLASAPNDADYLLITHEHFDHCSPSDIRKVINDNTTILATSACSEHLAPFTYKELILVEPSQVYDLGEIIVETIPAYNVNKFRSPGELYHPKTEGKVGYVVTIDGKRLLHAGDTDNTPELHKVRNVDVAFIPVSGTYVMTPGEAAGACDMMKPKVAIPMHYGSIVGSEADAEKFKGMTSANVVILQKE